MKSTSDPTLSNNCGLIAAAAWQFLDNHGVKARVLDITFAKNGHAIVVYEAAGRLGTYDCDGSLFFRSHITWDTKPIVIAKAWMKASRVDERLKGAKWFYKDKEN